MALTEQLRVLITGEGTGLIKEFDAVGSAARKAYGDVEAGAAGASTAHSAVSKAVVAGSAAAVGAVAGLAFKGVQAFTDLTSQARQYQRVSGMTAEESSKLAYATRAIGIEADTGSRGFFMLGKAIANHSDTLKADGVTIATNSKGQTDMLGTLLNVSDAYNAQSDQALKTKIATDAFGRSGLALIPILQRGRDGLQELYAAAGAHHEIFSQSDLEKGRQFGLATHNLGQAVKGVEIDLAQGLIPALTGVAHAMDAVITAGGEPFALIVGGAGAAVLGVAALVKVVGFVKPGLEAIGTAASGAVEGIGLLEGAIAGTESVIGSLALAGLQLGIVAGGVYLLTSQLSDNEKEAKSWARSFEQSVGGISDESIPKLKTELASLRSDISGQSISLFGINLYSSDKLAQEANRAKQLSGDIQGFEKAKQIAVQQSGKAFADQAEAAGASSTTEVQAAAAAKQAHQNAAKGVEDAYGRINAGAQAYGATLAENSGTADADLKKIATSINALDDAYLGLGPTADAALQGLVTDGRASAEQLDNIAKEAQKMRDSMATSFDSATSIVQNFSTVLGTDPAAAAISAKEATQSHNDAVVRLSDAQAKLNDLQSGKTVVADPAQKARDLATAQNDVARAELDVQKTSADAAKAQGDLGTAADKVNKFFRDQLTAARDWSTNLQALMAAGVDRGLIGQLAEAGPKAAPLVAALLDDVHKGNLGVINKAQTDMNAVLAQTQSAVLGYETPFFEAGQGLGTGLTTGIGVGAAPAAATAKNAAVLAGLAAAEAQAWFAKAGSEDIAAFNKALTEGIDPNWLIDAISRGVDPKAIAAANAPGGLKGLGGPPRPLAEGGIITAPTLALIGEAGYPEGVIRPNDPSGTARTLRALGYVKPFPAAGDSGGSTTTTTSHNYNLNGAVIQTQNPEQLYNDLEQRARLKALSGDN